MKFRVAVLQYDAPETDTDFSVKELDRMVGKSANLGAKLVVGPETAIGDVGEVKDTGIDYLPRLSDIARRHDVFLCTSYYRKEGAIYSNQGYIVDPDGKPVVAHRKIYLARPEVENIGVKAGREVQVANTEVGRLEMLICKDGFNKYSHFLYEELGLLGATIVCIPTWSLTWKGLNTQEYIKGLFVYGAFASRSFVLVSGNLNKSMDSFGRSLIVSPVRGVLKEGSTDREEILVDELDLDEVKKAREFDSWWQPKERII